MGMLSSTNKDSDSHLAATQNTSQSAGSPDPVAQPYVTPENTDSAPSTSAFAEYDPVEAGLLQEDDAFKLLEEFRAENAQFFPFVLVDQSISANEFRHQQPFLFLSIMAVMSYRTPSIQNAIADAFKEQVALRFMECSLKGLEAVQALLVHAAYYQFFYRPGKQQLALIVQMCVATTQDLGLAIKCRDRDISPSSVHFSLAENRALLGTYYIAAVFAQAWRKRTSVPYTRAIARACQSISQSPESPSDLLISPLVQSAEMMCRISDYFSYDSVEDSEVHGERLVELSTGNFHVELERFRDSLDESTKRNVALQLACDMIDVLIYECSFYGNLWQSPSSTSAIPVSEVRTRMLQRSLVASQRFAATLLGIAPSSLHHLAFPAWSSWFYSTMLVVKIAILRQTGSTGSLRVGSVPHAVGDFLPREFGGSATQDICQMTATLSQATIKEGAALTEEAELISIFESFIKKLKAVVPSSEEISCASARKPFLHKVATLQTGLLAGIKKLTEGTSAQSSSHSATTISLASHSDSTTTSDIKVSSGYDPGQTPRPELASQYVPSMYQMPFVEPLNFAYIDDYSSIDPETTPQLPLDDWLWTMATTDGNMFTL
ncbi:hypothetical protein FB567DRAFT_588155 [Paraphoma chrysanthemicola]|uniref:Transcription factor domain-containing protein n=1 Tax=Paraphoma chrysanthemicola TaxID=798071 RepID=A0A8K0RFN5_9PLEO|nr:hypothetical protein FB567DRAFT_588155 [Paraphoma chrysanthemicola]